jgi:hypothetical protein
VIRSALSVLPTRPVLYLVPVIVALVMTFYYWDIYTKCSSNKQFRSSLNELLLSMDTDEQFRLPDFTRFAWDKIRIVENFKPERRSIECPLGWNWPGDERESLVASGLLTVLIFAQQGTIVAYHELRSDEVDFRGTDASIASDAAVFSIVTNSGNSSGVTLTLKK